MTVYTAFASVYDRLMQDVDYAAWSAYLHAQLQTYGVPAGGRVLECACGTGNLTLPLAEKGYTITATDRSESMLSVAMEKARAAGKTLPFIRQDMRALHAAVPVHAVLCACDGVNYLRSEKDLRDFFSSAYAMLRPGGVLLFDISTPRKLREKLGNNTLFMPEDDCVTVWENRFSSTRKTVSMTLTFFVREAGTDGSYTRLEERQIQRAWEKEELLSALKNTGFCRAVLDARAPKFAKGDLRWHFAAVKP